MHIQQPELLIIDDRMDSVALLLRYFQAHDVGVMVALTAKDGLRKALEGQPDLILLDVGMPHMDGYQICGMLKAAPETAHIPVIFLSALDSLEHKLKGFAAGAVDYIGKPFSSEEVMARVYVHFKMQVGVGAEFPVLHEGSQLHDHNERRRERRTINSAISLLHDPNYVWQGVEALANKVGVIEKRLTELFRNQFGMTVSEYQINRRLEMAREKLSNSDLQIQRIAEEAGYLNASDFSRAFRQRYGMGPRDYRRAGSKSTRPQG